MGLREEEDRYNWSVRQELKSTVKDPAKRVFSTVLRRIKHSAVSVFEWKGLPDHINSHTIEKLLYTDRMCAVAPMNGTLPVVCRVNVDRYNHNGEPVEVTLFYPDGSSSRQPADKVALIGDTTIWDEGRVDNVRLWASRYAEAQVTIDTQMMNRRSPVIIKGATKDAVEKGKRLVTDANLGYSFMVVDSDVTSSIEALKLDSYWDVEELIQVQKEYTRRMLDAIGVDSDQAFGKKERLVVDEQESNDESLALVIQDCLDARRDGAERMKALFGITADVDVIQPTRITADTDTGDPSDRKEEEE